MPASLMKRLMFSQPTMSHHMKILCDSGVVSGRREGKWTYYSISSEGVFCPSDFACTDRQKYRKNLVSDLSNHKDLVMKIIYTLYIKYIYIYLYI